MLDKAGLSIILQKLDATLRAPTTVVAIGGTALNLLGLKESTGDVDLILESPDQLLKVDIIVFLDKMGLETQVQDQGTIVMFNLPPDYVSISQPAEINSKLKNMRVLILSPLDILITKLSRFAPKDRIDIAAILGKYQYALPQIEARFQQFLALYQGNKQQLVKKFEQFKKFYAKLNG